MAAGGGRVDGFETQQLVAAGLTLLQRSAPLVRALSGRRSAILLPASPAFVTALAASEGRGAVLINPLASRVEAAYQIADARVGAVFTTTQLAGRLPDHVTRVVLDDVPRSARVVVDGVTREIDLGSHSGLTLEAEVDAPASPEEAAIVYTSGFEGTPLGAILTHGNLLSNARATVEAARMDRDVTALAVLPFAHLFGLVVSGVSPMLAGGRVITMARFNPARIFELLEEGGISDLVAVPSVFATIVGLAERRRATLAASGLRLCICGGAPLAVELQERWFELTGVELRQGYGLTEAGPVCLFNRIDLPNKRGTLGVPFPGVHVAIRAERSDTEVGVGETGEICVSGPNVFAGYIDGAGLRATPERPWAAGLHRNGAWLRTGDRAVRNADGTASFRGVIKPMFTRNGFNIYPREIERVVGEMEGVQSVTAHPVADPIRENDIAIDVRGTVDAADVKRWCDERLSVYKRPTSIVITSDT